MYCGNIRDVVQCTYRHREQQHAEAEFRKKVIYLESN